MKSCENIVTVKVSPAPLINVVALLNNDYLVMTAAAIKAVDELWSKENRDESGCMEEVSANV